MILSFQFFFNSILLGVGLAMDAFSVSMANALNEPCMKRRKALGIAGMFAFFQAIMPIIGWICVGTVAQHFRVFEKFIPFIALGVLGFIGTKMLLEGIKGKGNCNEKTGVGLAALVIQGIATSIDALSVGFTIAGYDLLSALLSSLIIATVTFVICMAGLHIGKKAGTHLSAGTGILGGAILIFIGLEIFITGII